MSFHQYQGPKRFQLYTSDDEDDDDIPVFVFVSAPYLFTTTSLLQQLQLQLHSAFTSSNTDSDPNLICIVHRSMHSIALHCNAVRECTYEVDRQIHEKFPNRT